MPLRVVHLSTYRDNGGAARAAYALHQAMLRYGIASRFVSAQGTSFKASRLADRQLWRLQCSAPTSWRSPARFGSLSARAIDALGADVVDLHWVTDGFLSVETIGSITTPRVWSMYDMWPFSGAEHYGDDSANARWRTGYTRANRPASESGLDLNRSTWERKRQAWQPMTMIPASRWLAETTTASALMRDWPVHRIPHVVDEQAFDDEPPAVARAALGIAPEPTTITFLASAGIGDHRKGFDLLWAALPTVVRETGPVRVLIVGPQSEVAPLLDVEVVSAGVLVSDAQLRHAYASADVVAVPSRTDNLPLTAMEAQTCGRPVVAFTIGGLPDIVTHHETGYLARPEDAGDLATGLIEAILDGRGERRWSEAARRRALATWSPEVVVPAYLQAYGEAGVKSVTGA